MSVGDILKKAGQGALTGARAVGAVAAPLLSRTAEVVSGEAPQIDEEKRQQQAKMDDAALNAKADDLEAQLAMGRKYGTLTPEEQQQYVDQITALFSHPRHMNTLMTRLQRAIHPQGARYQENKPLPNATPTGGTAAADEKRAAELYGARRPTREYASPDGKERNWFVPGDEPDGWQAVQGGPRLSTAKSPPTPGNHIPQDAVGPDGEPIPPEMRTPAQSYIQWSGAWYTAPKPKPIYKIIGGNVMLMDPATGDPMRNLGPAAGVKISTHQTPFLGDDGQMHLLTTTSVTTPQGESIDVEAPPPDASSSPAAAPKTGGVGSILADASSSGRAFVTRSYQGQPVPGMISQGNIDITKRPNIKNPDGTHSSVFSMSFGTDKGEVLVPGVGDGTTYPLRKLTQQEALDQYQKTGQNLGTFKDAASANAYAETLHEDQAKYGNAPTGSPRTPARKVNPGSILPKVGAKTPTVGPAIPGSHAWANSKNPLFKADVAAYNKVKEDANVKQEAYLSAQKALDGTPTPSSDQELIYSWVRSNVQGAGRMTQAEFRQAGSVGSLPLRAQTWFDRTKTGRLPTELEQMLLADIRRSADTAQQEAARLRQQLQAPSDPGAGSAGTSTPKFNFEDFPTN